MGCGATLAIARSALFLAAVIKWSAIKVINFSISSFLSSGLRAIASDDGRLACPERMKRGRGPAFPGERESRGPLHHHSVPNPRH
jgi:hypothetical protein